MTFIHNLLQLVVTIPFLIGNTTQSQQTLITRQSLELGAELGQGEFGSVLKGAWTDPKGNKVTCIRPIKLFVIDMSGRTVWMFTMVSPGKPL